MRANQIMCPCCQTPKTISFFYTGLGIQNGKTLPYCRECCRDKLAKYSAILGEDAGAWVLMAEVGVPYLKEKWKDAPSKAREISLKSRADYDPFGVYLKMLKESEVIYQGFWDSDIMLDELRGTKKKVYEKVIDDVEDYDTMKRKWGTYDDIEAYEFLEDTFNEYTKDIIEMDANLENRYKDLCLAEYSKRKAQEGGDIAEISKAQDNVAKLLKLLKLDDFKENKQSDIEKMIERMAWTIENVRPAECADLDKYKDISGFEPTWENIMRAVKNLIGGTKEYPEIKRDI